jgi:Ca2+-binding EF-hand superfamily protein
MSSHRVIRRVEFVPSRYCRNGLTETEIMEIKELFDQFDTDGNGTISIEELRQAFSSMGVNDNQFLFSILQEFDKDRSGYLDIDEFVNMMVGSNQDTDSREDIRKVFNLILGEEGQRYGGKIQVQHLRKIAKELNEHMSDEEIFDMIGKADIDKDGAVDFEEFYQIVTKKI